MKSLLLIVAALPLIAAAHGEAAHSDAASAPAAVGRYAWGEPGDPRLALRTVRVTMADTLRFSPDRIELRRGQTLTFDVHNAGRSMHEFVIGTEAELVHHAELMRKFPGMEHDEPFMARVPPGQRGRISWHFTEPGTFYAGCLLPGHLEGGMRATIVVKE
jgi:uncharacterized cupredoxin-like copper-binding protein